MAGRLEGKAAIVTGAADGVGLAIARRFAEEGARVTMADADSDKLKTETERLASEHHEVVQFGCNVRERLDLNNLLAATIDAFDRVDIVVNAARRLVTGDILDLTQAEMAETLDVNLTSALVLSQAAAKRMIQQAEGAEDKTQAGAIINLSSIAGQLTSPELAAYSVTCAAIGQLTRSLAVALAPQGVRVNAIALGGVMTARLRDALREQEGLRDRMLAVTPMGRIGQASEAAEAAVFLAARQSSFITGQILTVDGGRSLLDPLSAPVH
jgi:7-alpha-hydroxysteroid dehydrogenase